MTENSTQSRTVSTSSTGFAGLVQELESTTLYVLSRLGPLQFAIKEDNNQKTYRVTIGSPHNCTCNCFLKAGTSTRTCIHLVFVLIKVLRIPFNHALASKTSYSDSELSVVLSGNFELTSSSNEPSRRSFKSIRASRLSTLLKSDGDQVKRQLLTEEENEDICPICQDDMSREQRLAWCKKGCGANIHAKCMQMFSQFKLASNEKVGCPLCREPWDLSSLREDCNGKSSKQQRCCASITCNNCLASQRGLFYRCYECSDASVRLNKSPIDFCSACFIRLPTTHTSHHFLSSSAACQSPDSVSWLGCPNPLVRNATIANAEFMNSLETRELTNNDYEMLLTLDTNRNSVDLALHLTKALLLQSELLRDGYKCSLCLTSSSSRLSCGHTVCENCLKDVIERALSEGLSSQVAKLTCPFNGCSSKLLPGLLRIRRKSVILPVEDLTPEGSTAARIPSSNQMSVAGSGLLTRTSLPPQGRSISASRLLPTLRTSRSFLAARPEGLTGAGNLFIIGSLRGTGSECLPVLSSQPQLQPLVLRRMPRGLLSIRSGRGDGIVRGYVRKERGSRAEDHGDLSSHLADEFVGSGLCLNVRNYSS